MRLDPDSTVREGRDAYLADNGFDMAGYTAKTFALPMFGREVHLPNPPSRQRALARHDLHHALTGYGTDYIGEAEIGRRNEHPFGRAPGMRNMATFGVLDGKAFFSPFSQRSKNAQICSLTGKLASPTLRAPIV